jgi:crotonobetainyl-CoA:carnitine CoA-transferase CaiB-like acyl-CoA transferase
MAILVQRQTGRGQYIDAALYEAAFSFMEPHIPAYEKLGHVATRAGSGLPDNVPNNLYPSGDGAYIHIAAVGDSVFRRFAEAIGQPELADDARFRSGRERARHGAELDARIADWTRQRDLDDIERTLQGAAVPAMRIYTMADIFRDPHYAARGALIDAADPDGGTVKMANVVPRLSLTPGRVRHAGARRVGLDTRRVLHDVAGLSAAQIDALERAGAIACAAAEVADHAE